MHQWAKPAFLLREGAIAMQHLHVAAVGKRAIEHLGRIGHPAQHLGDGSIFKVGELYAFELEAVIDMHRSEEHTSELQSLMRISYAVFCLKKKRQQVTHRNTNSNH